MNAHKRSMHGLSTGAVCVALVAAASLYGSIAQAAPDVAVKSEPAQEHGAGATAPPKRVLVALPLDHGPRAETTPAMNKKRLEAIRAQWLAASGQDKSK